LLSHHRADKTAAHGQSASDGDIPADVQRSRLPLPGADDLPEWAAGKECKTSLWILFQNQKILEHAFCRLPGTWAERPRRPNAHAHAIFANAAFLAGKAIEAATELQQMPGASAEAFIETLDFWHRIRDYAGTAALDCLGGNNTLAEALVTFRFLNCRGQK
jgi:hypothetical protein